MKTCTIWGDLSSEGDGVQYPLVTVCDACVEEQQAGAEATENQPSGIVKVESVNAEHGGTCIYCGKTESEELEEHKSHQH